MSWLDKTFGNARSIQGVPVSPVPPTAGQVLRCDGLSWVPTTLAATGGFTSTTSLGAGGTATVGTDPAPVFLCSPGASTCTITTPAAPVAGATFTVRVDGTATNLHYVEIQDVNGHTVEAPSTVPGDAPAYAATAFVTLPGAAYTWTYDPNTSRFVIIG